MLAEIHAAGDCRRGGCSQSWCCRDVMTGYSDIAVRSSCQLNFAFGAKPSGNDVDSSGNA
jgi:hypothetical protein